MVVDIIVLEAAAAVPAKPARCTLQLALAVEMRLKCLSSHVVTSLFTVAIAIRHRVQDAAAAAAAAVAVAAVDRAGSLYE
jgi:hypothetical protein